MKEFSTKLFTMATVVNHPYGAKSLFTEKGKLAKSVPSHYLSGFQRSHCLFHCNYCGREKEKMNFSSEEHPLLSSYISPKKYPLLLWLKIKTQRKLLPVVIL